MALPKTVKRLQCAVKSSLGPTVMVAGAMVGDAVKMHTLEGELKWTKVYNSYKLPSVRSKRNTLFLFYSAVSVIAVTGVLD